MPRRPQRRVAIPRRLRLKGRTWRVVRSKQPGRKDGQRGLLGYCDPEARTLEISAKAPRHERELTFLHEWLHGAFPVGVVDAETEERIVRGLEGPLHHGLTSGALSATTEGVG